jgi:hypothetical protein
MRTPRKRREPRAGGSQRTANNSYRKHTRRDHRDQDERHFLVNIVCFGRVKEWSRFTTIEEADAEIAKLRRIGFHAERVPA